MDDAEILITIATSAKICHFHKKSHSFSQRLMDETAKYILNQDHFFELLDEPERQEIILLKQHLNRIQADERKFHQNRK